MTDYEFNKRVLFIGIPDMALGVLDYLHSNKVNVVAAMGPEKTHTTFRQFKDFVHSKNIKFIEYDSLKSDELSNSLKELNIDIAVVASFNAKIPTNVLNTIKDGILNLHPSLLPKYRGGNPYSHVIINGETETGVTIHYMTEEYDKGDIIIQKKCPVEPNETMGTIFAKTNKMAAYMLLDVLKEYEKNGVLPREKQPDGEYITAPNIHTKDSFVNYNKSAVEIERFVRSLNPYITALSSFRYNYIKLHKVIAVDEKISDKFNIGDIYKIENNKFFIKTAKGGIAPLVLQYGAFFIGDSKDFIDIAKPRIGEHFGF